VSLHAVVVFTAIYVTGVPAEAKVSAVAIIPTVVDVLFVTGISKSVGPSVDVFLLLLFHPWNPCYGLSLCSCCLPYCC
jgi:hypothetical protein